MKLSILLLVAGFQWILPCPTGANALRQSERQIPVVREVDIVIVGGSLGAVAAANEAANEGVQVLLVAPRTYLGDDLCATLRLWLEENGSREGQLTGQIFASQRIATPMRVKKTLEAALLKSGTHFLLASHPTDLLVDVEGHPAGLVIANRSGRQAIIAKILIDATDIGSVALMAGATRRPTTSETNTVRCRRVVLGGNLTGKAKPLHSIPAGFSVGGDPLVYHEYILDLVLGDRSIEPLAAAEQTARDLTYRKGQLRASERLWSVPPAPILSRASGGTWREMTEASLAFFEPSGVNHLFVLSGAADISRADAVELLRPAAYETYGRMIGKAAAKRAKNRADPIETRVRTSAKNATASGDIREVLRGLRPVASARKTVPCPATDVPILAEVDVLVIGGGTSGACAAIGAARQGVDVLVVEYQEGLGGVGTMGLIGRPYYGQNAGFTLEVPFVNAKFTTEDKMEWFRQRIREHRGKIWFGAIGCGAVVRGNRVVGAVVSTPSGRGLVLAKTVIDATGNADIAVAAGAASFYGDDTASGRDIALQGTGLPVRTPGAGYVNSDYLLVDESDAIDVWRALVGVRLALNSDNFDMGTLIQTRERRRVVGDHVLCYLDQIVERTYPDSIVLSGSDYDSHGYPSEPFFALIPHTKKTRRANHPAPGGTCYTPYRCLLPKGLEGILVIGLGISMRRDAAAMVRMQRDMHNQGYAAGVAAAMVAKTGDTPRQLDVKRLQQHLVEIGNLPKQVLTDVDSFPLSAERVAAAVQCFVDPAQTRNDQCKALAVILSHPTQSRPAIKESFAAAEGKARFEYAKLLGFLGLNDGVLELIEALDAESSWDNKILQGRMAEYAHLPTPQDGLILSLGYSGDRRAIPVLVEKLDTLDASVTLSHHRSLALALEQLGDPAAAEPIAKLLSKRGIRGHAMKQLETLHSQDPKKRRRIGPLREIVLARALYRCGDFESIGQTILREYQDDLRGLFSRHANAVLASHD